MVRRGAPATNQATPTATTSGSSRLYVLHRKVSGIANLSITVLITIPSKNSASNTAKRKLMKKLDRVVDLIFVRIDTAIQYMIIKLNRLQSWLFLKNQAYHGADIKRLTAATED